jgi:Ca2+-binding RTX toxin-like protein
MATEGTITIQDPGTARVLAAPGSNITGTELPDILNGTDGNDTISALGGNDTILGSRGSDRIDGGAGIDTVDYKRQGYAK